MPLRYQLLLLSLLTLLLPWAGCRYAREMETVLRDGEQQTLLASAATLANLLAARPQLMYGEDETHAAFDPKAGDLYAYRLPAQPLLDGYGDDWGLPASAFGHLTAAGASLAVDYATGTDERYLYLLLEVQDDTPQPEQTPDVELEPEQRSDHVWLVAETPAGLYESYLFATSAPGLISARRPTVSTYGQRGEQTEPRIQAFWQPEHGGYRLEARVPLAMIGARLGFEVVDIAPGRSPPARAGTLDPVTRQPNGRLLTPSAALEKELGPLLLPGTRIAVSDMNGWILAQTGSLPSTASPADEAGEPRPAAWLESIYRQLLESGRAELPTREVLPGRLSGPHAVAALGGEAGATWFRLPDERRSVLAVATPIATPVERLGVLLLEQSGDRLLTLRDRALTRLLDLTFLVTGAAVLAMLAFATLLSLRLGRLKRAAENALARDGRLNTVIPETDARDELGDLARSYAALLARLGEYTSYLRTLAAKLAHELRTPLTIVRSSLENLESERMAGGNTGPYVERALEGTDRLHAILSAMSAATRTEEAIQSAERTRFDLRGLVDSAVRAYADAFPARRFAAHLPQERCEFTAAPDLILQLLDKLVDNAVDFSLPGSSIEIELRTTASEIELGVVNQGAAIPEAIQARVFDSMFQFRRDPSSRPHFGLGLYIVRLIAEFHGGRVQLENLPGGTAVRFSVHLPRIAA